MKFTLGWLKVHLDTTASLDEIVDALTRVGLEVEGVDNPGETLAATARRWGPTTALLLAYVAVLEPLGFLLATAAYVFTQARLLGSVAWRRDLVASVALSSATYFVFKRLLQIALPAGILG